MFSEEENIANKSEQREPVLNNGRTQGELPPLKRLSLLIIGSAGLFFVSFIAILFVLHTTKEYQSAITVIISYFVVFAVLIGVLAIDIPKYLEDFKNYKKYLYGLVFGAGIILFTFLYTNFVNLFYPINTSSNESGVRSIIDLFPFASIIILGIVGPLCEELAYRVGLFGLLKKVNRVVAYVVSALIFGFLHFDFTSANLINELIFLPTYIAPGVLLAVAYDLFGLPCSWVAHSLNNLFAVIIQIIAGYLM